MKEIFDWLRKVVDALDGVNDLSIQNGDKCAKGARIAYRNVQKVINEAEAKWKEKEAELRASVIDEFAEKFIYKAVCEGCSFCCICHEEDRQGECEDWKSYMKIASQMKGEKECQE